MRALLAPLASLCLATSAGAQDFVGINAHLAPDDVYDLAASLGVGWVRIDNNWFAHEPAEGAYDWAELDRAVDRIVGHGQRVYMTIAYAPAWALERGAPPSGVPRAGAYARYVTAVVERYRDRVQAFGLWNEPNLEGFFAGTAQEYVERVLRPGALAIHAACPACKAVGPELASVGPWTRYLETVLQAAGGELDVISHHTYARPAAVHTGWICDDFEHALDSGADPICFYKPGLRQILDEFDTTRDAEVWITEAGYRADPWDAPAAQQVQLGYVQAVLQRQLETPWWTRTDFYELVDCRPVQPDCDIDGFGLARRRAGPDADFSDNFLRKPSFLALADALRREPALSGGPAPAPPARPPRRLVAPLRQDAPPDADLSDFAPSGCLVLPGYVALGAPRDADDDLYVQACAAYSPGALHLGFDAIDSVADASHDDAALWLGDSVQVAADVLGDARPGEGYGPDDFELTAAWVDAAARLHVEAGAPVAQVAAVRDGAHTRVELRLEWPAPLRPGDELHVGLLVNDADGAGRDGFAEWTPGIGREKRPAEFGRIVLSGGALPEPVDAGAAPVADAGAPVADAAPPRELGPHGGPDADVTLPDARPDAAAGTTASPARGRAAACSAASTERMPAPALGTIALLAIAAARIPRLTGRRRSRKIPPR